MSTHLNDLFFGRIKFVRVCRSNERLTLVGQTFKRAGREFISFLYLFYLLFISQIRSCSNLFLRAQILFEITLTNLNTQQLVKSSSI